jgi:hypothetical protein
MQMPGQGQGRAPTAEEMAQMESERAMQVEAEMQMAASIFMGYAALCTVFHVAVSCPAPRRLCAPCPVNATDPPHR